MPDIFIRNTGKFLSVIFSEEDLFWGILAA